MSIQDALILSLNENNFNEFKRLLLDKTININSSQETSILLKCILQNKILYFKEYINTKTSDIFYANFDKILQEIIKYDCYEFINLLYEIKNIHFYINFENIIDISIENDKYNILNYILKNNIIDFNKNIFIFKVSKILDIKNYESVDLIFDKLEKFINTDSYHINSNSINKVNDNIFSLFLNFMIKIQKNFINDIYKFLNDYKNINIFKFNYIYSRLILEDFKNDFLEQSFIGSFEKNNVELLNYLLENFNFDNSKILSILKKNNNNSRNILKSIIKNHLNKDTSLIIFNKLKEQVFYNKNTLIYLCIENNNNSILNTIHIDDKINKRKIEKIILDNYNHKYIDNEILLTLFNKCKLLDNINFTYDYLKLLISNNDKILFNNAIDHIYKLDEKYIKNIEKKIRYYISEFIINDRLQNGDIYDWYFLEWLNLKVNNINILEDNIEIIRHQLNTGIPNVNFLYWYLGQDNKVLEKSEIEESLLIVNNRLSNIDNFMIDNIEKDYILVNKIKSLLTKDNPDKIKFIESLYLRKVSLEKIKKLENYDNDMTNIFNNYVYNNKIILNIFKKLIEKNNNDILKYLLNRTKNIKITTYKIIVSTIINFKNYDLLDKIKDNLLKKDSYKFYQKILLESIKYYNYIIFEWAYDNLLKYNNDGIEKIRELDNKINKVLNELSFMKWQLNTDNFTGYNFLLKIYETLSVKNKELLNEIIFSNYNSNEVVINNFVKNKINITLMNNENKFNLFNSFIYNINRSFILNQFNEVKFEIEDYIYFNNYLKDESSKLERLKFNLLYQHNIDFIIYLKEKGIELKFDNGILIKLLNDRYFNRKNNSNLNNYNIIELIIELKSFDMFDINIETLNIFLENYSKIKCKITLDKVIYLVKTFKLEINYDSLYFSASSVTKDIFNYLNSESNINLKENNEELLLTVCLNDDIDFAKYLLEIEPTFDLSRNNDNLFSQCCNEGSLDIIKWLNDVIVDMHEKTKYEYSICGACYYGHLNVAKWLVENIPNLDIKVDNDYCMVSAVENECYNIISWILEIEPDRYIVEYNDEMDIINFKINKKLLIEQQKNIENIVDCPICYENKSNIVTCCNHQFCYECFSEYYMKNTNICCPYCRKEKIELFNIINS